MKNYIIIISLITIFLIPLNVSAINDETLRAWMLETTDNELVKIEDENQPHASTYVTLYNKNGELVGVSHVTASLYLEHPVLYAFLAEYPVVDNVTIGEAQYEMKSIPAKLNIDPDFCFDQKGMGQGNIQDVCFFYTFTSDLDISFQVDNQKDSTPAFRGLHHGFLTESGDVISMVWTVLIPTT